MEKQINTYQTIKEMDKAIDDNPTVVVMVSADWCPPCQTAKPILKKILKNNGIPLIILNGDDGKTTLFKMKNMINSYPTFIVYKNGKRFKSWSGWDDEADFRKLMGNLLTA